MNKANTYTRGVSYPSRPGRRGTAALTLTRLGCPVQLQAAAHIPLQPRLRHIPLCFTGYGVFQSLAAHIPA